MGTEREGRDMNQDDLLCRALVDAIKWQQNCRDMWSETWGIEARTHRRLCDEAIANYTRELAARRLKA